ncbi:hypothetical protein HDV06_000382 [Boothiomyces sp. JEL0866]|nr:hypothetical protein HDV06_000382 [Boothiomyces sp. JEL0866]
MNNQTSPTPTANNDTQPSFSATSIYFIIPVATIVVILLSCLIVRLVPYIQFKSQKPIITEATEEIQVAYEGDSDSQSSGSPRFFSQDLEDINSIRTNSQFSLRNLHRPSNLRLSVVSDKSLTPVPSRETIVYIMEGEDEQQTVRTVRSFLTSNAVVTVGAPPEYDEVAGDLANGAGILNRVSGEYERTSIDQPTADSQHNSLGRLSSGSPRLGYGSPIPSTLGFSTENNSTALLNPPTIQLNPPSDESL